MATIQYSSEDFDQAVRRHDARLEELGLIVWVGSEPTFTDRMAQSPEWLNQALGGDKEARARALLGGIGRRFPGGMALRSVGRQYPGEARPRWNLGLYRRRDGAAIWPGPPDPILSADAGDASARPCDLDVWTVALAGEFAARGWRAATVEVEDTRERRLVMVADAGLALPDAADPRLARASVHDRAIPGAGLRDELAESGAYLFALRSETPDGEAFPCVELPMFSDVAMCLAVLDCVGRAAVACGLPALVLAGYPPPADAEMEWTTVTPDPAVIEINSAPSLDAADFLARSREIYAAAAEQGLSPFRLYYNGAVADSGGAGQITLGGPAPAASPFLGAPRLLPNLVRYFNRHPALSYLYSHDFVGGGGQSVRADERGADALDELGLALELLDRVAAPSPETLWHSLAPFLCDGAGNSHRAELNIEKLWNPFLPGRGQLGLVEFRALRMQHTPERATALVCLLRAVVAMLARAGDAPPLTDWGRELHRRFALPFYLEQDLGAVLDDLADAGLELEPALQTVLRREEFRFLGSVALPGGVLEVRRALEFWPLLGDVASPEQGGGSRLVDASAARLELRLRPAADPGAGPEWDGWEIIAAGIPLPMRRERDAAGPLKVFGLRYRGFVPGWGLHPTLGAQTPVRLLLRHADCAQDHVVTLHEWRPDGEAYAGLPGSLAEAGRRRAERLVLEVQPPDPEREVLRAGDAPGLGDFCLDLRWLPD